MGNVCGCGNNKPVDNKEKEKIKAFVSATDTRAMLHQIDMVKNQFKNIDDKNIKLYFDALNEVISAPNCTPRTKFQTLLLLNSAIENNPKALQVLKQHPLYSKIVEDVKSRKAKNLNFGLFENGQTTWDQKYDAVTNELMGMTTQKYKGQLPEFEKLYEQNKSHFLVKTNFTKLNSESYDKNFQRLDNMESTIAKARTRAVEETMEKVNTHQEIKPVGILTEIYSETVASFKVENENLNEIEVLNLVPKLDKLKKEIRFHDQFSELIKNSDNHNLNGFELSMRNLVVGSYPEMTTIIDRNSDSINKSRRVNKDNLDDIVEGKGEENYEFELENEERERSKSRNREQDELQKNHEKEQLIRKNQQLKQNVSHLITEKRKLEESIRQQSFTGRSYFQNDRSNLTSSKIFNPKSFVENPASADLLKILNDKEMQIEKLKANCDKLQRTFDHLHDPNNLDNFIANDNLERSIRNMAMNASNEMSGYGLRNSNMRVSGRAHTSEVFKSNFSKNIMLNDSYMRSSNKHKLY